MKEYIFYWFDEPGYRGITSNIISITSSYLFKLCGGVGAEEKWLYDIRVRMRRIEKGPIGRPL